MHAVNKSSKRTVFLLWLAAMAAALCLAPPAGAELLWRNFNQGACQPAGSCVFTLPRAADINRIEVMARWRTGQTRLAFSIAALGRTAPAAGRRVHSGVLLRQADCRRHHPNLCRGAAAARLRLPAGEYRLSVEGEQLCSNSEAQNHGMLALFGQWVQRVGRVTTLFANPRYLCKTLQRAEFSLTKAATIRRLTVWVVWPSGANRVAYRLLHRGRVVHSGVLIKHHSLGLWGRGAPGVQDDMRLHLSRGTYRITISGANPCGTTRSQNQGFVHVLGY